MDVELKTGGMARMPVGHDENTKRQIRGAGFRNQVSVNSQGN